MTSIPDPTRGFAKRAPDFSEFLTSHVAAPSSSEAIPCRNFLIDEWVPLRRVQSYSDSGAAARHASCHEWRLAHEAYLAARVFRPPTSPIDARLLDHTDVSCPETFSAPEESTLSSVDLGLDLIRVEHVAPIARSHGIAVGEVVEIGIRSAVNGEQRARRLLGDVLDHWAGFLDRRPTFAAFWEDLRDIGIGSGDGWPNTVRDRLGLAHLDPAALGVAAIPVFVFRYPVSHVPRRIGRSGRFVTVPTVLDSRHSVAFCPAPVNCGCGQTIDLGTALQWPRREVVHPTVPFDATHLFAVGHITAAVQPSAIAEARLLHIMQLREQCGRPDYALEADPEP